MKGVRHTPSHLAAFTQPDSAPAALSVLYTLAVPQPHHSADPIPPFKVISRRRDSKVINKTSLASVAHPPSPKTTRKGSNPSYAPARVDGGGQLARAAAYIRERSTRRSSAFDKFICRTPKVPQDRCDTFDDGVWERCSVLPIEAVEAIRCSVEHLDEISEISEEPVVPALEDVGQSCRGSAKRQPELLVVSETETSAYLHSPITSVALTPLPQSPAVPLQAKSIDRPSLGLDWLLWKPPDGVGFKQCLYDTISVSFTLSVTPRSPEFEMGFNPVSQPGHVWANPTSRSSSLELVWWERIKPPNK